MDEQDRKHIDESWKNQVTREKADAVQKDEKFYEPSLLVFLSSLSMQAMIAMGKMENPVTGKTDKNLDHARFLIDTLHILKEKMKGNLNQEEERFFEESLFNLRMTYVDIQKVIT